MLQPNLKNAALKEQTLEILREAKDMTIATIRDDGFPQATTVSYINDGLSIYFGSAENSQKALNLSKCNKVSLTVNGAYDNWDAIRGISLAGTAQRVTSPDEMRRIGDAMIAKFPQIANYVPYDPKGIALFRIDPVVISVLDYTKGFGHAETFQP